MAAPLHTRRLGVQSSLPFVTDGLYADTQDALAGYWIVEGDSFDLAIEIAGRLAGCTAPEHVVATRMPTYGRSWNPPPKFPSRTRGADKQR